MNSITFFTFFVPVLSTILLGLNFIFAPHNPYQEKAIIFECGFKSFLGQNRTQFSISFFIFGLLFLIFDLELVMALPGLINIHIISIYGFAIMIIFFITLAIGFAFEIGKKALVIESKQQDNTILSSLGLKYILDYLKQYLINLKNTSLKKLFIRFIIARIIVYGFSLSLIYLGLMSFDYINTPWYIFVLGYILYRLYISPQEKRLHVFIHLLISMVLFSSILFLLYSLFGYFGISFIISIEIFNFIKWISSLSISNVNVECDDIDVECKYDDIEWLNYELKSHKLYNPENEELLLILDQGELSSVPGKIPDTNNTSPRTQDTGSSDVLPDNTPNSSEGSSVSSSETNTSNNEETNTSNSSETNTSNSEETNTSNKGKSTYTSRGTNTYDNERTIPNERPEIIKLLTDLKNNAEDISFSTSDFMTDILKIKKDMIKAVKQLEDITNKIEENNEQLEVISEKVEDIKEEIKDIKNPDNADQKTDSANESIEEKKLVELPKRDSLSTGKNKYEDVPESSNKKRKS